MTTRYFLSSTASDLSGGADFSKKLDTNPGFGTTLSVTIAASATETSYGFTEALVPGRRGSVGLQEYAVSVKVNTAGNMELKIQLRRISASGTVLTSSSQTAAQSLNSAGVKKFEVYADLGRFEKDERIRVDFAFTDLSAAGSTVVLDIDSGSPTGTWFFAPWDAGLLRPNMRNALDSAYVVGGWLVEMDLPSPNVGGAVTTVRGALAGAAAPTLGNYPQKVSSISRIPLGVSLSQPGIESPEVTIEWEDTDHEISKIVEGPNGDDVIGSAVRVRFAVDGLAEADWHTRFKGVIRTRLHLTSRLAWRFTAGVDDRKLTRGEVPRVRISKSDFPDAPDDVIDQIAPEILGIWDSSGVSGKGAVPTVYVDNKNFRYLVAHGSLKVIRRVYKDDILLAAAAWTRVDVTVNGRTFTLIDFTTDQGTSTITADVEGYQTLSGVTIERPIEVLYTWLENFVSLDGGSGITSVFAPSFMNDRAAEELRDFYEDELGLVAAKRLAEVKSPDAYLRDFFETWNYRGYWGPDGRLVVKALDHRRTAIYLDDPWARGPEDEAGPPEAPYEDKDLADRVIVNFLQDAVAGGFAEGLEVRDPAENSNVADTFDMTWGAARIV